MIDHISIAVRDLDKAARFYEAVLGAIGYARLEVRPHTVGFGKTYPELWLNRRASMAPLPDDCGAHVALRVRSTELVDAFHAAALAAGGSRRPRSAPAAGEAHCAAFIRTATATASSW
jgi:catechol 2,3-dioxygenase-like lactoylglutathione lyase family enzyme